MPNKPDEVSNALKVLEDIKRPDIFFTFPAELERKPIKMTYGLEMDIRRMLPDPGSAMQLLLSDPYTQDYVIRRCLTEKNHIITDPEKDLIPADEVNLDGDIVEAMLMWAASHAIYFFAKRTAGLANLGVQFAEMIPAQSVPSLNGSKVSDSKTPSAGDSESSSPS